LGDTYHVAIGQGDLLVTPLQINRVFAEVVSGKKCTPRLYGQSECVDLQIDPEARKTVMEGMRMACEAGGTGFPFFDLKGAVLCKTGTAQHGGETTKPHAWMGVVVPTRIDNGELIIDNESVMLDEAGEGSEQAGPVARKIVDYILRQKAYITAT
jgi:penicillin-binding protein 2